MTKFVVKVIISFIAVLFIFPSSAYAHPIEGSGIVSGFTHLFLGLDHLLAILVVGIIITVQITRKVFSKK